MTLPRYIALIPAAGRGARMKGTDGVPKQYLKLGERTMLEHTVTALLASSRLERVYLIVAGDDSYVDHLVLDERVEILRRGGNTRAESVRNALLALVPELKINDKVLVHDAVRPCITVDEIDALIDAAAHDHEGGGALLATPVVDTLKHAHNGRSGVTAARHDLWRAATPQLFDYQLLLDAMLGAHDLALITDEASAVEALGGRPLLVQGLSTNIKVTHDADLPLAIAILKAQGRWQ